MYRALYRKWRPQTFSDVVGQEATLTALTGQILHDRVGHAYLFTGTRGTGKTSCAKIFAKAVNCENRQEAEPCGKCVPCLGLEDGSILDVTEIDAASNNSVDDVRDLRDETAYRPSRCKYKVYIIDEVHMLSTSAFNALLKILEEPPSHVIFILATTEIHKVPATILSRCQRYDFTRIPAEKIAERLIYIAGEESIALTPEAADLIARIADGGMRDAVSLLETCSSSNQTIDGNLVRSMAGIADKSYLFSLSDAVLAGEIPKLLELIASLREKSIDVRRLTEEMVFHYRNFLLTLAKPDGQLLDAVPQEERKLYIEKASAVGEAASIKALKVLAGALDKMGRAPDPRIELELALFELANINEPAPVVASVSRPVAVMQQQTKPTPAVSVEPAPAVAHEAAIETTHLEPQAASFVPNDVEKEAPPVEPQPPAAKPPMKASASIPGAPAGSETEIVPFEPWPEVVKEMANEDRMLHSYMKKALAFTDGRRVLIDGGEMFLSYMRNYENAAETIKAVIHKVTGVRYGIGPYTHQAAQTQTVTARDTLQDWEAKGIPVEYK